MKKTLSRGRSTRIASSALILAAATVLAAACGGGAGANADGESVEVGATKEQYVAALEDMEPVTLRLQSALPEGRSNSIGFKAYADAVEDWSGGRIAFEMFYSSAVAPPGEDIDAFTDGRLDLGIVIPGASPERFPVAHEWSDADQEGISDAVVNWLAMQFATLERGFESDELLAEYEGQGIHVLLPYVLADDTGVLCTEPPGDGFEGRQVRVGSPPQTPQAEALGMTPVSLPFTEIYEGLQRGIVDCVFGSLGLAGPSGFIPLASNWIGAGQNLWGTSYTPFGFSDSRWDELPLAARQLLHDRLDVYIESVIGTAMSDTAAAYQELEAEGGSVRALDDDAVAALRKVADERLDQVRSSDLADGAELVEEATQARQGWVDRLSEAGYDEVPWADFGGWYAENDGLDLSAAMDLVRSELLRPSRPTG